MRSALAPAISAALERLLDRHPSAEEAFVPLSEAVTFARLAGADARLMCAFKPSSSTLTISLTTSDPAPVLALREVSDFQPGALGHLLNDRRQVREETWEYEEQIVASGAVFFLRLNADGKQQDVAINWQAALILNFGWRDDFKPNEAAEALVYGEELARAIVQVTGIETDRW